MRMGATMATCNTIGGDDGSSYQNGSGAAAGIIDMIRGFNERSFRKRIGQMLASGDCAGAVKYAYQKGRIELGASLQQTCNRPNPQVSGSGLAVEARLSQIAASAKTPLQMHPGVSLTQVQARGAQLELTFVSVGKAPNMADERASLTQESCANEQMSSLFRDGASIRAVFFDFNGKQLADFSVSRRDCGSS
jgi:hypothetical protein